MPIVFKEDDEGECGDIINVAKNRASFLESDANDLAE